MSDDLFEGMEPNHQPLQPQRDHRGRVVRQADPLIAAQKAAQQAADYAAFVKRAEDKKTRQDEEWSALQKSLVEPASDTYKGLWIGLLPEGTTALQHSKHICGTKVAKEQFLLPRHNRYMLHAEINITPAMLKRVVIFRLDDKQMLMAKLNKVDREYLVSDNDGSLWAGFAKVIMAGRHERDMSFLDKERNSLVGHLSKLFD